MLCVGQTQNAKHKTLNTYALRAVELPFGQFYVFGFRLNTKNAQRL